MRKFYALILGLLFASSVNAQTYNLFKPANGILKGSTSTYVTTAAASSDVRGLWTGTCNASTFLRGDGACAAAGGGGTSFGNSWDWVSATSSLNFSYGTIASNWLELTEFGPSTVSMLLSIPGGNISLNAAGSAAITIDPLLIDLTSASGSVAINAPLFTVNAPGTYTARQTLNYSAPSFDYYSTTGTANEHWWRTAVNSNGDIWSLSTVSDDGLTITQVITAIRGGNAPIDIGIHGPLNANDEFNMQAEYGFGTQVSATAAAGVNDNFNPGGSMGSRSYFRITPDVTGSDVTGFQSTSTRKFKNFLNVGTAGNIVLKNEAGTSSAGNRILTPGGTDFTVAPGGGWTMIYDGSSSRWRVFGTEAGGGGGTSFGNSWDWTTSATLLSFANPTSVGNWAEFTDDGTDTTVQLQAFGVDGVLSLLAGTASVQMGDSYVDIVADGVSIQGTASGVSIGSSGSSNVDIGAIDLDVATTGDVTINSGGVIAMDSITHTVTAATAINLGTSTPAIQIGGSSSDIALGFSGAPEITLDATSIGLTGAGTLNGSAICTVATGCGGGGSPGGATTNVQYNNAGAFGGEAAFAYNSTTDTLTVTNLAGSGAAITALSAANVSTGTLAVARGGTGTTTSTGTGNTVLSASPTLTGTVTAATVAATAVTVGGNNVCQSTGTNCPTGLIPNVAYGRFTVGGSACTHVAGAGVSSCAYNGTGNVTVTFTATAGTGGWICTANSASNTQARALRVSGASTTTISILSYATAAETLVDADFTMTCMAN